jgi:divalent metal cation (Fe/Co/Zn/Cd) transporter
LTSIVALVAIAGGQIYPFLDPVGGCFVSLLIIRVGYQSGKAACQEIVDRGIDQEILDQVKEGAVRDFKEEEIKVSDVRGTKSGTYYIVDVEVECDGTTTVDEFDDIKEKVMDGVKSQSKNVKIVRVFVKARSTENTKRKLRVKSKA